MTNCGIPSSRPGCHAREETTGLDCLSPRARVYLRTGSTKSRWRQTDQSGPRRDIRLQQSPDSQWTARNLDHGLTAQGKTSREAPDALEDVVEAVHDEGGHEPTDPEAGSR